MVRSAAAQCATPQRGSASGRWREEGRICLLVDRTEPEPEPAPDRAIRHGAWRMDDAGAFAWTMEVGAVERVRRVKTFGRAWMRSFI